MNDTWFCIIVLSAGCVKRLPLDKDDENIL